MESDFYNEIVDNNYFGYKREKLLIQAQPNKEILSYLLSYNDRISLKLLIYLGDLYFFEQRFNDSHFSDPNILISRCISFDRRDILHFIIKKIYDIDINFVPLSIHDIFLELRKYSIEVRYCLGIESIIIAQHDINLLTYLKKYWGDTTMNGTYDNLSKNIIDPLTFEELDIIVELFPYIFCDYVIKSLLKLHGNTFLDWTNKVGLFNKVYCRLDHLSGLIIVSGRIECVQYLLSRDYKFTILMGVTILKWSI